MMNDDLFLMSSTELEPDLYRKRLLADSCGGFVSFEGWVRNHHEGRAVESLTYTSYEGLANKEGARVMAEALEKFAVEKVFCVHRVGALGIGGMAVWVGVAAAHREAAFLACQYVIDEVKSRVPIWKEEGYVDGTRDWVACHCGKKDHEH